MTTLLKAVTRDKQAAVDHAIFRGFAERVMEASMEGDKDEMCKAIDLLRRRDDPVMRTPRSGFGAK